MKVGVEMVESLRYKLLMFGVPIDGSANVLCDNKAVYKNTITPESVLKKKHNYIACHRCREALLLVMTLQGKIPPGAARQGY